MNTPELETEDVGRVASNAGLEVLGWEPHPKNVHLLGLASMEAIGVLGQVMAHICGEKYYDDVAMVERCRDSIKNLNNALGL
jgi:hypothetical protein